MDDLGPERRAGKIGYTYAEKTSFQTTEHAEPKGIKQEHRWDHEIAPLVLRDRDELRNELWAWIDMENVTHASPLLACLSL